MVAAELASSTEAVELLEKTIKEHYEGGEQKLAEWMAEETQFKKDVVDIGKHKGLGNPYDLDEEKRKG